MSTNPKGTMDFETLDPRDWDDFKRLGREMVSDMTDHFAGIRDRPAWQSFPESSAAVFAEDVPEQGENLASVYETFKQHILPYPTGNAHPGFWGWVMGNGTPTGMLADMLASGMNPHLAGYDQAASAVERQVIRWMATLMGFPADASGLLVSGGTMANLNGLAVARHAKAGFDIRQKGLQGADTPYLTVFGSEETHSWILTACELMGLGREAWRPIPVNENYQVDVAAMAAAIEADLGAGNRPFCIVGTVGTVNSAAVDDVTALRQLADQYDLWLHIDGAFGSMAALAPRASHLVAAQSSADSIAFDLHKWGYLPYEVGCILGRDPNLQTETFAVSPSYLSNTAGGLSVATTYFADRGVQLSRGFRALKVWMTFKEQGTAKMGRLIQRNIDQAAFLEKRVLDHENLALTAPVSLNVVCFRFFAADMSTDALNHINEAILQRLQQSGRFVPSHTVLGDVFSLRVCITNHRTARRDLEALVVDVENHAWDIINERPMSPEFRALR